MRTVCCLCMLLGAPAAWAGEIVGTVAVKSAGLFSDEGQLQLVGPISVAAMPAEGQTLPAAPARVQRVVIEDRVFSPAFVTLRAGDSLEFVNRDAEYYELFSLSSQQPFAMRMGKAEQPPSDHRKSIRLNQSGTWHVFCRIHNKAYFRVDVVDTPHVQELAPGETFRFSGLGLGRWRLRVAALGSEVLWVEANAITAPPPVEITLPVMASALRQEQHAVGNTQAIERLFPARP